MIIYVCLLISVLSSSHCLTAKRLTIANYHKNSVTLYYDHSWLHIPSQHYIVTNIRKNDILIYVRQHNNSDHTIRRIIMPDYSNVLSLLPHSTEEVVISFYSVCKMLICNQTSKPVVIPIAATQKPFIEELAVWDTVRPHQTKEMYVMAIAQIPGYFIWHAVIPHISIEPYSFLSFGSDLCKISRLPEQGNVITFKEDNKGISVSTSPKVLTTKDLSALAWLEENDKKARKMLYYICS